MIAVEVSVEAEGWRRLGDVEAVARRAAEAAFRLGGPGGGPAEIAVLLADDEAVRALNRAWRGKDQPTNVLSFPAPPTPGLPGPCPLGDVVLAYETCAAEAAAEGKPLADHVSHLVVHGVLHLLGRDHDEDEAAEAMEALEVQVLASLGVADPYRAMQGSEERDPPPHDR